MTQQEMAFDVANRYLHGSDIEKQAILSCFTDEEKKVFLTLPGISNFTAISGIMTP